MKNIGTLLIIGLLLWWLTKGKQAQAATGARPGVTPGLSEYELMHTTVPITGYAAKTIPVFGSIEELNRAMGVS